MISNFGWDYIYRPWGGEFVELADWIAERFSGCDRLYRLPFYEPMSAFPNVIDTGLTGGTPYYSMAEVRNTFNITAAKEQTILLTFGGLGLAEIPYHNLTQFPDWQFITFDRQAPDLPNIIKVNNPQFRPVDFMPLCDRVVSKPGYSTFAESCRMDTPIVSITRDDFAESALLIEGIRNHAFHQILEPTEFFQEGWQFLREPVQPPRWSEPVGKDGNETIANDIVEYLNRA